MSIIITRGGVIAADRCASYGDLRTDSCKVFPVRDGWAAGAGSTSHVLQMVDWYRNGAHAEMFPASQREDKDDVAFLVVTRGINKMMPGMPGPLRVVVYERTPHPIDVTHRPYVVMGNGREVAAGAMEAGATVKEAAEICARIVNGCGGPIDVREV